MRRLFARVLLIAFVAATVLGMPARALGYVGPGAGSGGLPIGITGLIVSILVATIALCLLCGLIAAIVAGIQRLRARARHE